MNDKQLDMVLGYLNEGTEIDEIEFMMELINETINQFEFVNEDVEILNEGKIGDVIKNLIKKIRQFIKNIIAAIRKLSQKIKSFGKEKKIKEAIKVTHVKELNGKTLKDLVSKRLNENFIVFENSKDYEVRVVRAVEKILKLDKELLLPEVKSAYEFSNLILTGKHSVGLAYIDNAKTYVLNNLADPTLLKSKSDSTTSIENETINIKDDIDDYFAKLEIELDDKFNNLPNLTIDDILDCCKRGTQMIQTHIKSTENCMDRIEKSISEIENKMRSGNADAIGMHKIDNDNYKLLSRILIAYQELQSCCAKYLMKLNKCEAAQETAINLILSMHTFSNSEK